MQATFLFNDGSALTLDHVEDLRDIGRDYEVRYKVPDRDDIMRVRYVSKFGTEYASGHVIDPAMKRILLTNIKGSMDRVIEVNGSNHIV